MRRSQTFIPPQSMISSISPNNSECRSSSVVNACVPGFLSAGHFFLHSAALLIVSALSFIIFLVFFPPPKSQNDVIKSLVSFNRWSKSSYIQEGRRRENKQNEMTYLSHSCFVFWLRVSENTFFVGKQFTISSSWVWKSQNSDYRVILGLHVWIIGMSY